MPRAKAARRTVAARPDDARYHETIALGAGGNGQAYLVRGWKQTEPRFAWTDGEESTLTIRLPAGVTVCRCIVTVAAVQPHPWVGVPHQQVYVLANRRFVDKFLVTEPGTLEFVLRAAASEAGQWIELAFLLPSSRAGEALTDQPGAGLGLGISSIAFLEHTAEEDAAPFQDLMLGFESLGSNCEFGLVQRTCGVEPIGLFRWASTNAEILTRVLRSRFASVGQIENLKLTCDNSGEYLAHDVEFGFFQHTLAHRGEIEPEKLRLREARRFRFLADKLIEDLREARKIFVFSQKRAPTLSEAEALHDALCSYGANWLLWVVETTEPALQGRVEIVRPGLLRGYSENLATVIDIEDYRLETWKALCQEAARLRRRCMGAPDLLMPCEAARPGADDVALQQGTPKTGAAFKSYFVRSKTILDLDFGIGGNATPYLRAGWSGAEDGYTWTLDDDSIVEFARPPEAGRFLLRLDAGPCLFPKAPRQRLEIYVNGRPAGATIRTNLDPEIGDFLLPAGSFDSTPIVQLRLHHPDATEPSAHYDTNDDRRLAFAVRRLRILMLI